ncbi:MAG: histidine phosphatase family protein [Pseudomonadota bacterium]
MGKQVRLYLVRHGEAAAKWSEAHDPGLSGLGKQQAEAAAESLSSKDPLLIKSSPLLRARETAAPLCARWNSLAEIIPAVAEIPSPDIDLADRPRWLYQVMAGGWRDAGEALLLWRKELVAALTAQREDCAIFSHFVAINAAVGAATGDDAVIGFRPDNCSITVLDSDGASLTLVERGRESLTIVG